MSHLGVATGCHNWMSQLDVATDCDEDLIKFWPSAVNFRLHHKSELEIPKSATYETK